MKIHEIKDIENMVRNVYINENDKLTMRDVRKIESISDGEIDAINNGFILGYYYGRKYSGE
ncbi:MAG: hypothetical protein AB9836_05890 [Aminipila sp.]